MVIRGKKEKESRRMVSPATSIQEKLENPGLMHRFLNWLSRGTKKSHRDKTSCPG